MATPRKNPWAAATHHSQKQFHAEEIEEGAEGFIVIRDHREHNGHGWEYPAVDGCAGMIVKRLDTADYTLKGYEDVLAIERKGSVLEFVPNLRDPRFDNEMGRLKGIEHAVVMLEFTLEELLAWPTSQKGAVKSRAAAKETAETILDRLWELRIKHKHVDFDFVGIYGYESSMALFRRVVEKHGHRTTV